MSLPPPHPPTNLETYHPTNLPAYQPTKATKHTNQDKPKPVVFNTTLLKR